MKIANFVSIQLSIVKVEVYVVTVFGCYSV